MRRFRDWVHEQLVNAIEPQLAETRADTRRAVSETALALGRSLSEDLALARAELADLRREHEKSSTELHEILERMEEELEVSHASVRALVARVRTLVALRQEPGRSRVVGGTIDARDRELEASDHGDVDIDLAALEVGTPVEVRSRFSDGWFAGFVVADVMADDGAPRYRVVSEENGRTLPTVFSREDVRVPNALSDL